MLKLYGSKFSLYTGKARSYLIKKGIAFNEITSTLGIYKKIIIPKTGVRYIPVVQTQDDQFIQDTTDIIDHLETKYSDHPVYPESPKQCLVSMLLEVYGDEWLVIPAMHYRWNFPSQNNKFIYAEFGSLVLPNAPKWAQRFVGKRLGNKFKGFLPSLGVSAKTVPAIEASFEQLLKDLNTHFAEYDYLLGGRPTIGDFGFIGPLYAHLYRDPAPGALMRKIAPNVCAWVERMNTFSSLDDEGSVLLENDEIPATLIPILLRMAQEQLPVLADTNKRLHQWRQSYPDTAKVARFIGMHKFYLNGIVGQRALLPYALWMLQRPLDFYHSSENKEPMKELLESVGLEKFTDIKLQHRLVRRNNKLYFADAKIDADAD